MTQKLFFEDSGKEQWLSISGNIIFKAYCSCIDFQIRRIKKIDKKIFVLGPCKHLNAIAERNNLKFEFRKPKEEIGYKVCPEWLKKEIRSDQRFCCKNCKKHENEIGKLEIHRIKRREHGGLYSKENCQGLCSHCHYLVT